MIIKTLEISGFKSCLEALRLPYGLDIRSNLSGYHIQDLLINSLSYKYWCEINDKDLTLLSTLVKRGPEHSKCIRGINVYAKITAPIYWWCEMETYTIGHYRLASESTMHIDCKGLSGEELVKTKSKISMDKELTKIDMFNYQNLRNIYFQRKNHRLPEWNKFCDWIKTLPYAKELITIGYEDKETNN